MDFMKTWVAQETNPEERQGQPGRRRPGSRRLHRPFGARGAPGRRRQDAWRATASSSPWPIRCRRSSRRRASPSCASWRPGRSDYPNQINNVLCFPGFFRGPARLPGAAGQRRDEDRRGPRHRLRGEPEGAPRGVHHPERVQQEGRPGRRPGSRARRPAGGPRAPPPPAGALSAHVTRLRGARQADRGDHSVPGGRGLRARAGARAPGARGGAPRVRGARLRDAGGGSRGRRARDSRRPDEVRPQPGPLAAPGGDRRALPADVPGRRVAGPGAGDGGDVAGDAAPLHGAPVRGGRGRPVEPTLCVLPELRALRRRRAGLRPHAREPTDGASGPKRFASG